jgi:fatty-acyl-CoA synthase
MTTFSHLLQRHFTENPDNLSLVLQHTGQPDKLLTYRDLLTGANRYAQTFVRERLLPGEVVILIFQHGEDLVYSFWGAVLHGAIPAIMPYLTEKLSPERYRADLASLIDITKPAAIVTYPEIEQDVRDVLQESDSVRIVITNVGVESPASVDFGILLGMNRAESDLVLLQHSSGTTGLQKGVALSHQAVLNQLEAYGESIKLNPESDVIISWLPLYHDMGLIASFIMPILCGVPLVLMSPFDWVRAPYRLLQSVSRYKGTLTWLPNFAYNFCAQKIRNRDIKDVDLSTWRAIINCSEPVRAESHQLFYDKFRSYGLKWLSLQTSYAMAENVFGVTQSALESEPIVLELDREAFMGERVALPPVDDQSVIRMMSSGRPIKNTRIRIVDENLADVPEKKVGEIMVQSDCMLTGYFNRLEITDKAIKNGWYLTGDYGFMTDGELFVSGRKKDLIIVGGKNIYPQDLESLASEIPGVHPGRVVAFGVYNEELGTEDVVIIAEADDIKSELQDQLSDAIRRHVTKNSAIALRYVEVVGPKWIIKTSSGKTARAANKEKFLKAYSYI